MTDWVSWFRTQLQTSGDGFVWAYRQIPFSHQLQVPPGPTYLGTWEPARHLWHVTEYERCLVLPSMQQWLGGPDPDVSTWPDDDVTWAGAQHQTADELCAAFQATRRAQIQLLDQLVSVDWMVPRQTIWGMKPLAMVVTKTFQHTYEHGDTLLRMGLWWDDIVREIAAKASAGTT